MPQVTRVGTQERIHVSLLSMYSTFDITIIRGFKFNLTLTIYEYCTEYSTLLAWLIVCKLCESFSHFLLQKGQNREIGKTGVAHSTAAQTEPGEHRRPF